jgi:hypothetical protein
MPLGRISLSAHTYHGGVAVGKRVLWVIDRTPAVNNVVEQIKTCWPLLHPIILLHPQLANANASAAVSGVLPGSSLSQPCDTNVTFTFTSQVQV